MKELKLINLENVSDEEAGAFDVRQAARAVVFDENNLKRECLEEIGCGVEVIKEIGLIVEYRKKFNIRQTSYCYIVKLIGQKGVPKLEPDEIEEGFETVWMPLPKALEIMKQSKPITYQGPYMVTRDTAFIEAALEIENTMYEDDDFIVKPSIIEGYGVFAKRVFKKGEAVLIWHPTKLNKEGLATIPEDQKRFINTLKDGTLVLLNIPERYINSSDNPNTSVIGDTDVATRDILIGEEITSNYELK